MKHDAVTESTVFLANWKKELLPVMVCGLKDEVCPALFNSFST